MTRAPLGATLALLLCLCACRSEPRPPAERVHDRFADGITVLLARVDVLDDAARAGDPGRMRAAFADARLAWKAIEHLSEQYYPTAAELVNGPPIDEFEEGASLATRAEGLQVIEALLFPEATADTARLVEEIDILRANVSRIRAFADAVPLTDGNVFEAVRLELLRIASLGLSGFDTPLARRSVPEAAAALAALGETLAEYDLDRSHPDLWRRLDGELGAARAALAASPDFVTFDRLAFLTEHLIPLHRSVEAARVALGVEPPAVPRAWRTGAATPYDADAWDPSFFSPTPGVAAAPALVELGRALFHEPLLSGDGTRSCATCHQPERGFADGVARQAALGGGRIERNTPTVVNAALQLGSFHDLRTTWLEDQARAVLASPVEMRSSSDGAAERLARAPAWVERFRAALPERSGAVAGADVERALAAYVRSLVALDAPFDLYLRGRKDALGPAEMRGFNTFMGRAQCGACHFAPLFGGAVPPTFGETEVEVLGVPARPDTADAVIDPDEGRVRVDRSPLHRYAFRTPTVRNVELTAPYMHNGVYATLEQVVDFYDRGGGAGIGIELEHQTLSPDPLELTEQEKSDLVAFMKALTDAPPR